VAAYHWLRVTCGQTVCTPGSASGSTLANKYRKTLPLPFKCNNIARRDLGSMVYRIFFICISNLYVISMFVVFVLSDKNEW